MRKLLASLPLACLVGLPGFASACQYPVPPTLESALKQATSVFIFQLVRADYHRTELGSGAYMAEVEGRIRPLQELLGDSRGYKKIVFETGWCGGVTLVVGRHYLIATNSKTDTIELVRPKTDRSWTSSSSMAVTIAARNCEPVHWLQPVAFLREGKPLPPDFPPAWMLEHTITLLPPPPQPLPKKR